MMKAMQKAERERQRDKRRTLNMFDKLDIDKIKIPEELLRASSCEVSSES